MKIGLVYATKTGHSKKIADAVAQELKVEALDVRTNPRLGSLDLLYVVGGIYGGQSAPELIDFVNTLQSQQVKRVALITSGVSQRTRQKQISEIIKRKGISLADEFKCKGSFLFIGIGHPNADDINNVIAFAKKTSADV